MLQEFRFPRTKKRTDDHDVIGNIQLEKCIVFATDASFSAGAATVPVVIPRYQRHTLQLDTKADRGVQNLKVQDM